MQKATDLMLVGVIGMEQKLQKNRSTQRKYERKSESQRRLDLNTSGKARWGLEKNAGLKASEEIVS